MLDFKRPSKSYCTFSSAIRGSFSGHCDPSLCTQLHTSEAVERGPPHSAVKWHQQDDREGLNMTDREVSGVEIAGSHILQLSHTNEH